MALEIERKYLVREGPLTWPVPVKGSHIVQAYLKPLKKKITTERVRFRVPEDGGPCVYTHTTKVRVSDGVHEEVEREISKVSFDRYVKRRDFTYNVISKVRGVFTWAGRTFELDVFLGDANRNLMILEVELLSMDEEVILPPFINIEREVTTEREYTNAALARRGHFERASLTVPL